MPGSNELSPTRARQLAEGWFTSAQWALTATTLLQLADVRAGWPARERLIGAVAAAAAVRSDLDHLLCLLAAALSGSTADGLLDKVQPDPSWVAAASDGPVHPASRIRAQFNLVDGYGEWIWNEGRPADEVAGWLVSIQRP